MRTKSSRVLSPTLSNARALLALTVWLVLAGITPAAAAPALRGLEPTFAEVGEAVVLFGIGFDPAESYTVRIDGVAATVQNVETDRVTFAVPGAAGSGTVELETATGAILRTRRALTVLRSISVASDPSPAGYTIGTAYGDAGAAGGSVAARVKKGEPDLVLSYGAEAAPALMGIALDGDTQLTLNAASTAAALIFLQPGVRSADPGSAANRLTAVDGLAATQALADLVDAAFQSGSDYLDDPGFNDLLLDAIRAYAATGTGRAAAAAQNPGPAATPAAATPHSGGVLELALEPGGGGGDPAPGLAGDSDAFRDDRSSELRAFAPGSPHFMPHPSRDLPRKHTQAKRAQPDAVVPGADGVPSRVVEFEQAPDFLGPYSPLDWITVYYEIDPFQTTSSGRLLFDRGNRSVYNLKNDGRYFERLDDAPVGFAIVRQAIPVADQLDVVNLIADKLFGEFPAQTSGIPIPVDRSGLYMARSFSGAVWPDQFDLLGEMPDGYAQFAQAAALNVFLVGVDYAGLVLKAEDIVGEEAFNKMIFGIFLATQKSIARAASGGDFDRSLLLTLAKEAGVSLAKGAAGAAENALTGEGFFRKAGKLALKTIDLIGKLGTAVQAEARWMAMTNDDDNFFTGPGFFGWPDKIAASVESTAIVVGDPWSPQVTAFEPAMAYRGDVITIRGKRFSTLPALNIVEFGEMGDDPDADPTIAAGIVLQATETSLLVQVPIGIDNATQDVSIGVRVQKLGGTTTDRIAAAGSFRVLGDPILDSIDPVMPVADSWATVSGANFSPVQTYNRLETRIGNGAFQPQLNTRVYGDTIQFQVPDTSQAISVRLVLTDENLVVQRTSNTMQFTPEVLAPPVVPSGAQIAVTSTGDNLAADDKITLREALLWSSGAEFRDPSEDEGNIISGGTFGAADADVVYTLGLAAGEVIQLNPALGPLPTPGAEDELFSFARVVVDGGGLVGDGLRLVDVNETLVGGFTFRNFDGHGILLSSALGNRITNSGAENCTGDGVVIEGESRSNEIVNVASIGNAGHGIRLEGAGVRNNTFSFFYSTSGSDAREIADNGGYGLLITGGPRENRLHPGHMLRNGLGGIRLEGEDVDRNTLGTLDRVFGPFAFMDVADNMGHGIHSSSSDTYIRFARITGNQGDGIRLDGSAHTGSRIASCQIGFDFTEQPAGNTASGIHLLDSVSDVFIGDNYTIGFNVGPPNVIGDNGEHGILLDGPQVHHIRVNNSRIGASIDQRTVAGNSQHGVAVIGGSHDNTLGDLNEALHLELMNHTAGAGIFLAGDATTGNVIVGNAIGVLFRDPFDFDSGAIYGNKYGIQITDGAWGNIVGQRGANVQQTINGVQVRFYAGNLIYASEVGVLIESGGDPSQQFVPGQPAVPVGGNVVQNNVIGTTGGERNNQIGVLLRGDAKANRIGGDPASEANGFRGNTLYGIHVDGLIFDDPSRGNRIVGNSFEFHGTQTPPADPFLERTDGIAILVTDSQGIVIGGDSPAEANTLHRNLVGVQIENSSKVQVRHNRIGNRFGTSTSALLRGNRVAGAILVNSQDCEIGPGNEVLANGHMYPFGGIGIFGGQNNRVFGNSIGATWDGKLRLANEPWGVLIRSSSGNVIGGAGPAGHNAIVATRGDGVLVDGGSSNNRIVNNSIGRRSGAAANEKNTMAGVRITGASVGNIVGGEIERFENGVLVTTSGRNTIHSNTQEGIVVSGAGTSGNSLLGNSITGHAGGGIDNVAGGNGELAPPTITDATDSFIQGVVDPSIPAGSLVEVFSDLDDEGEVLAGQARTDAAGFFRAPRQSSFAAQLHATVTHAVTGDTSEFGPEYVLTTAFDVREASGVTIPASARAGDGDVVLLPLRVQALELVGEVTALRVEASGTLHDPSGIAELRVVEDRDGDGQVGDGDAVLGTVAGFADDDGIAEIPLQRGILNAGDVRQWLVVADLGSSATRGADLALRLISAAAVDARSPFTRSPLPVTGVFPADGDPVTIDQASDIGTRLRLRVSSDTGDGPDFTSIQEAIDAAGTANARVEILPGLGGVYTENLVIDTDVRLVLDGAGAVTIDGLAATAVTVATGNTAPVVLKGLTLSGETGLSATGPVELETVRFENVTGTGAEFPAGDHTARGLVVTAGAQQGLVLGESASLMLDRGEIRQTVGAALTIDGTAWVASTLVAGSGSGAIVGPAGSLELIHATFADMDGAAIDSTSGGFVSLDRSILWNNTGGDLLGTDCTAVTGSNSAAPDCSGEPGAGNLSIAPSFLGGGDYRLAGTSPLIDQGIEPSLFAGTPCFDLDGNPRAIDRNADGIAESDPGAYEALDAARNPAEVGTLVWSVDDRLTWPALAGATAYHAYRGEIASLAYDALGICVDGIDGDLTDTEFDDLESPLPGVGWFYVVTADELVEGSSGLATCSERSRLDVCP